MLVLHRHDTMLRLVYWLLILGFIAALVYLLRDPGLQALLRGWLV